MKRMMTKDEIVKIAEEHGGGSGGSSHVVVLTSENADLTAEQIAAMRHGDSVVVIMDGDNISRVYNRISDYWGKPGFICVEDDTSWYAADNAYQNNGRRLYVYDDASGNWHCRPDTSTVKDALHFGTGLKVYNRDYKDYVEIELTELKIGNTTLTEAQLQALLALIG